MYDYELADRAIAFAESLKVPEGALIGQDIKLIPYQIQFIRNIFKTKNGKRVVKLSLCSLGRKNAKSSTTAMIILIFMCVKGIAKPNAQLASGGKDRKQASVLFNLMKKFIRFSPELSKRLKIIDSKKTIVNLNNGCEYEALSRDAGSALGRSLYLFVQDECANLKEDNSFPEACMSSQLAYDDSLSMLISTIGPSDTYYFNSLIEEYKDNTDESVHCVYYTVPEDAPGMFTDPETWRAANPALGFFLSEASMRTYAEQALKIPTKKAHFLNYMMNQKISADESFMQTADWRAIKEDFDYSDYYGLPAVAAMDLSLGRYDLTSLVIIVKVGSNEYKALPYTFTAKDSMEANEIRLKAPLKSWSMDEKAHLITPHGKTFDWEIMAKHFVDILSNFDIVKIGADPYKLNDLERELEKLNYSVEIEKMRQGFISFDAYVSALENMIYNKTLAQNGNPLLGYCVSNAVLVRDPAKNKKLIKRSENTAIDGAISLAMAAYLAEQYLSAYDDELIEYAFI